MESNIKYFPNSIGKSGALAILPQISINGEAIAASQILNLLFFVRPLTAYKIKKTQASVTNTCKEDASIP